MAPLASAAPNICSDVTVPNPGTFTSSVSGNTTPVPSGVNAPSCQTARSKFGAVAGSPAQRLGMTCSSEPSMTDSVRRPDRPYPVGPEKWPHLTRTRVGVTSSTLRGPSLPGGPDTPRMVIAVAPVVAASV